MDIDLELKLLTDEAILVSDIPIFPISLNTIAKINYSKFNRMIKIICITEDDIKEILNTEETITPFDFILSNVLGSPDILNCVQEGLSLITRKKVVFSEEKSAFLFDEKIINKNNFIGIQNVIRIRNGLEKINEEKDNPSNEMARKLLEKRKKYRQKVNILKNNENRITLADLVSILASGIKLPIREIMRYDIYQFNNQFNRLKMFDDYEISVQALLHGANKDDVNLIHWINKI